MAFNGSGSFSAPGASFPAVASTLIESAKYNAVINDIATGLSTCILKDGTQTVTANIPFGGFKLTGVGPATARTDAATLANNQDGTGVYVGTVGGTADVITLTPSPAITAYVAGQRFSFIASGANTTNVTVAISSLTAKAITKNGTTALAAGDIPSGALVAIVYDGTEFQLSPQTKTLNGTAIVSPTISGATLTTSTMTSPTITGPAITGTVTGGASYTSPALTTPTIDGFAVGMVKLTSSSVSSAAALDIVMTSYTAYRNKMVVLNFIPATDAVDLLMEISTNGGSSFDASGYAYAIFSVNSSGSGISSSDSAARFKISSTVGNAASRGTSVIIRAMDTTNAAVKPRFLYESVTPGAASDLPTRETGSAVRLAAQDTDAIRFLFSAGNIASGTYAVYGFN